MLEKVVSKNILALFVLFLYYCSTNLTWRDVQYLIVYTSNQDILVDGEWVTNGAGLRVSHKFGFGVIDAEALVTRARRWISVPEQQSDTVTPSQTDRLDAKSLLVDGHKSHL